MRIRNSFALAFASALSLNVCFWSSGEEWGLGRRSSSSFADT